MDKIMQQLAVTVAAGVITAFLVDYLRQRQKVK